jgi:hypothetical protein
MWTLLLLTTSRAHQSVIFQVENGFMGISCGLESKIDEQLERTVNRWAFTKAIPQTMYFFDDSLTGKPALPANHKRRNHR